MVETIWRDNSPSRAFFLAGHGSFFLFPFDWHFTVRVSSVTRLNISSSSQSNSLHANSHNTRTAHFNLTSIIHGSSLLRYLDFPLVAFYTHQTKPPPPPQKTSGSYPNDAPTYTSKIYTLTQLKQTLEDSTNRFHLPLNEIGLSPKTGSFK